MQPIKIIDDQWAKLLPVLRACPNVYVGSQGRCRKFLSAVVWVARSGAQWRLLPPAYGKWNSIYKPFARWSELKVFAQLFEACAQDPDLEHLLLDSTILRAHPCAAGAQKNTARRRLGGAKAAFQPSSTWP